MRIPSYILNYCSLHYVDSGTSDSSNHAQNDVPEIIIISVVITFLLALPLGMLTGCCVCWLWARQKRSGDPKEVIYEEPGPAQVEAFQLQINDSYMATYMCRETDDIDI